VLTMAGSDLRIVICTAEPGTEDAVRYYAAIRAVVPRWVCSPTGPWPGMATWGLNVSGSGYFPALTPWGRSVKRRRRAGPTGPAERKVPASQARRRGRTVAALSLTVLAAVWVVPALILRPVADPAALAWPGGLVVGLGFILVRGAGNARGARRLYNAPMRYLTAFTWTGPRTIDLSDLKRIRARRIAGGVGGFAYSVTYLMVTDSAGVRISFSDPKDFRLVRQALEDWTIKEQHTVPVKVSRLARHVLGIQPLPAGASALWTLASVELPILIILLCVFTIIPLAAK